jgi:hypothetical protein
MIKTLTTNMKFTKKKLCQNMLDAFKAKYNSASTVYTLEQANIDKKVKTFYKSTILSDDEVLEKSTLFANRFYETILPRIDLQHMKDYISKDIVEKSINGSLEEEEFIKYSESFSTEIIKSAFNQTVKLMRKQRKRNKAK